MQYTSFPGVNSVGHDEQSGEPFGKITQQVQVNTQPAANNFTEEKSEGAQVDHVSPHTHRRYDAPEVSESFVPAVKNVMRSCPMKFISPRNMGFGHCVSLYIGL